MAELAESIKANGLLEPIVVCLREERFCLIAGYRRLTACEAAGLTAIPCIIREGSDPELIELALLENIQRTDLTYIEEAESYRRLMDLNGIDAQAVAKKMHKAVSIIYDRLSLLGLPADIQELVAKRAITIKAALEIGKIDDAERRARLAAKSEQMKLEDLKELVAKILEKQKQGRKKYEKHAAQRLFKEIFEGLPVKRVYKDQVTFVFADESEFITALKKVIERYESENWVQ